MEHPVYREIVALGCGSAALERTIEYAAGHLGKFLKRNERVILCFPEHTYGSLSYVVEQAILKCGAVPVLWGPDHRWKSLLQQCFFSRASTIIGPPLIILGLTKLKKHNGIPLYIRHVVTAGYPCLDWMIDGIVKGLDCKTFGSFGLGITGAVAGFSCGRSRGVHLREEEYGVDIVDDSGASLPPGETGEMVLYPKAAPHLRLPMGENARLVTAPCPCGCTAPRLMDMIPGKTEDLDLINLGQYLQSWTSVLDCRLRRGPCGLELEMVVFPGEKLPKLPSAARQVIRPWDPKHDEPFAYTPDIKNFLFSEDNH